MNKAVWWSEHFRMYHGTGQNGQRFTENTSTFLRWPVSIGFGSTLFMAGCFRARRRDITSLDSVTFIQSKLLLIVTNCKRSTKYTACHCIHENKCCRTNPLQQKSPSSSSRGWCHGGFCPEKDTSAVQSVLPFVQAVKIILACYRIYTSFFYPLSPATASTEWAMI